MIRREQEDPELDVSEFTKYFASVNPHNYGWSYTTEISEEVYKTYTYHSIWTFAAPVLTFKLREPSERVQETYKTSGSRKMRGAVVTASPYDFHGQVEPAVEWKLVNTFEGPVLSDAKYDDKIIEEDICFTGKAKIFNTKLLSARPSRKLQLPVVNAPANEEPLLSDPNIQKILEEKPRAAMRVISSAKCLAAISVCNRAVCPFELVFEKKGNDIFVYPRSENSPAIQESTIETITVPPNLRREEVGSDFINSIPESSNIAAQFIAACQGTEEFKLGENSNLPGDNEEKPFVYRRFILRNIEYIVRCEIDCLRDPLKEGERPSMAICRTFNDLPTSLRRTNWAVDLEKQRSSLVLAEVKDNSNMFARWTAIGRLMDCTQIFLGFAERKVKTNPSIHVILAAERQAYGRNAGMISLTEKNMMGMMYLIFSKLIGQGDGIYHFQRDARKKSAKIYKE